MKKIEKLLALLLAMVMVLGLAACAGNGDSADDDQTSSSTTEQTEPEETEPQESEPGDEKDPPAEPVEFVYTVTVEDTEGNPIEGVFVQICAGTTCVPKSTDAEGVAGYDAEITGDGELAAKIISLPEGYTAVDGVTEIAMGDETDVVFVLAPENADEQGYVYTVQVITVEDMGVEGVWVQICAGTTCVPKQTDAHGMAGYEEEITGDGELVAKIISIPEGYEIYDEEVEIVDGVAQITFPEDVTDVIFVLREIQ